MRTQLLRCFFGTRGVSDCTEMIVSSSLSRPKWITVSASFDDSSCCGAKFAASWPSLSVAGEHFSMTEWFSFGGAELGMDAVVRLCGVSVKYLEVFTASLPEIETKYSINLIRSNVFRLNLLFNYYFLCENLPLHAISLFLAASAHFIRTGVLKSSTRTWEILWRGVDIHLLLA